MEIAREKKEKGRNNVLFISPEKKNKNKTHSRCLSVLTYCKVPF
jgi:hypothetical protein